VPYTNPHATVIEWTDPSIRVVDGHFIQDLLRMVPNVDFAVMVFRRDDIVVSRGQTLDIPRDNVIFELGLFMSQLTEERAFIIKPKGRNLKVLSDLAGVTFAEYEDSKDPFKLTKEVRKACDDIAKRIDHLGPRARPHAVSGGPSDVLSVKQELEQFYKEIRSPSSPMTPISICNMALDMQITRPIPQATLIGNRSITNVLWRSIMIDSDPESLGALAHDTVSHERTREIGQEIQRVCDEDARELRSRQVNFQCKAYSGLPLLHGFLVNDKILLLTLCDIRGSKLFGHQNPYLRLEKGLGHVAANYLADPFKSWFDYQWERGDWIWPTTGPVDRIPSSSTKRPST
jgi:Predicted nucleotide-binding protein containing TIR-like domain